MKNESLLVAIVLVVTSIAGGGSSTINRDEIGQTTLQKLFSDLKKMTEDLWKDMNDPRWHAALAFSGSNNVVPPDQQILQSFARFGDVLERTGLDRELKRLRQRLLSGEVGSLYVWASSDAEIGMVDVLYEAFRRFQVRTSAAPITETSRRAFTDLAETILQEEPDSVPTALSKLHDLTIHKDGGGVFGNLPRVLMENGGSNSCDMLQSPQQLVYNVYNIVFMTDIKGYAMMQFSWILLSLYKLGNYTMEAKSMRDRIEVQMAEKREIVRQVMPLCSNQLWLCDPQNQEENTTYIQLTKLLQGHIQNEIDLNPQDNCREDCAYYSGNTFARVNTCYQGLFCDQQPKCRGRLFGCRFIDSDSKVCLRRGNLTHRKYDWIEYKNGRILGTKDSCYTNVVNSWWRWVVWHCSYCFCLCDEQGPQSDRYFSLHAALARGVDNDHQDSNRAVTGLRFVKVNRVIHLQIQDGVVLPGGTINSSTLEWRPIRPFTPSDPGIIRREDFHMMTWEQRAIDLDDLVAPEGSVLTGVKLRLIGPHLNLEILTTPINITSGRLAHLSSSEWIGNENTPAALQGPRTEVILTAPDIPTRCPSKSVVDSKKDQFITFTHSDIDKDVAQTTVPFLDAQPVVPDPPSLLIGAGLYHKGKVSCGGFVAPKVITYDYSQHLITSNP